MDIKVVASMILSFVIAYLVYAFSDRLFSDLSPLLFWVYVASVLALTTADVFLIIRQKVQDRKILMIAVLVLSLLSAMIISRPTAI